MNYKLFTISITDVYTQETETKAYFKPQVAFAEFRRIVNFRHYEWRNCLCRVGDTLKIAETYGDNEFKVELSEHELLKNL